jgi:tyrosine-protein phosphatase SIW14
MPQKLRILLGLSIAAMIVFVPIGYATYSQSHIRNFHVVRDGVLYRSGQMSLVGLQQARHDFGIRTVITLRDSADPLDRDNLEEVYCKAAGITHVRIPPREWYAETGRPPADKGVQKFLEIMNDRSNYPVLVHCFAGIHRSGAFCAVYRMEQEHWSNGQAIEELKNSGYFNIHDEWDVLGYLEDYRPQWKPADATADNHERTARAVYRVAKYPKPRKKKKAE